MDILEGILYSLLWASAAVATKFAMHSVDPFLLTCMRFLVVAIVLMSYTYLFKYNQERLPTRHEFKQLLILGLLNVTIYMTGYIIAIKTVSAGLISLFMATNPLILILLSAIILKRKLHKNEYIGIVIALAGLILAAIPNLKGSHASIIGLAALVTGITSLSFGSIYFSKKKMALNRMTINTWQITFGGIFFIPIIIFNAQDNFLKPDLNFFLSFLWLVIPVTIIAYALWLKLLQRDPVKAGLWLFLTPGLGYFMAVVILHEPLTLYGIAGALLVVTGLLYSRKKALNLKKV
jgi:probable blue pigment (indigoidine) exporter